MAATLRVASWNIRSAIGPGPFPDRWWSRIDADRLRAIGSFVTSLDVDLVALQEVAFLSRDGELVDNAGDLARQLGMDVRYGAVRSFEARENGRRLGVGCFGNAILSRRPIRGSRTISLPRAPVDSIIDPSDPARWRYGEAPTTIREPRCLLLVEVEGLTVGSTHFSHIGPGERRLQAVATVEAFGAEAPALLLGDLNAPIEAPELDAFADWTDAFVEPPGDAARISVDDGMRIDQVLTRDASVNGCRVVRDSGDLSDHYPVVATVDPAGLRRPRRPEVNR